MTEKKQESKSEYRKIIEFGKSSHVISLPREWMKKNKLSKGETVYVNQLNDKLLICPKDKKNNQKPRQIEINLTGKPTQEIKFRLISAYIRNFSEIILIDENMPKRSKEVRDIIHDLMSLEVVEETSTRINTRIFLSSHDVSPSELIRKMDNITKEMIKDSKKTLFKDNYMNIRERDTDVNRISYLIFRTLKGYRTKLSFAFDSKLSHDEIMSIWVGAENIEKIADRVKWISKLMRRIDLSKQDTEELVKLYSKIEEYYSKTMDAFYKGDTDAAFALGVEYKNLIKYCRDYHRHAGMNEWIPLILEKMKDIISNSKELLTYVCNSERNYKT